MCVCLYMWQRKVGVSGFISDFSLTAITIKKLNWQVWMVLESPIRDRIWTYQIKSFFFLVIKFSIKANERKGEINTRKKNGISIIRKKEKHSKLLCGCWISDLSRKDSKLGGKNPINSAKISAIKQEHFLTSKTKVRIKVNSWFHHNFVAIFPLCIYFKKIPVKRKSNTK